MDRSDNAFGDRGEIKAFLIADIRGYTAFTQEYGDDSPGRLASRFAAITREVAEGRSGLLLELIGDEVLVAFDSARQAIRAAIDLQERFVDETVSDPTLPLAVGIGLDVGEGVPVQGGYRGSAVNRASRLCAVAGPGEVLASGEVIHLAGKMPGVTFTPRGDLNLRGASLLHVVAVSSQSRPAPTLIGPSAPPRLGPPLTSEGSLRFCILGPLEVIGPDHGAGGGAPHGRLAGLGPPKQRAVLAILLLNVGEIVPVERLIELVWRERPPRSAGHSIQIYMSDLRKTLEPAGARPVIITRPPGYLLEAEPDSIDARRFERLIGEGARALGGGDPTEAASTLRTALRLWRGQPLADFAYDEFAQADIRRLQGLRLAAIENLSRAELVAGTGSEVLPMLETAVGEDPLRERLREVQMLALYRSGRQADALHVYQDFRRLAADELGLDPSPALQRLQERILLHDASLGPEASQPEAGTIVRNPYKGLRPFSEEDAEDFFGRGALVAQLLEWLAKGVPLLAAVGPSGCGKSSVVAAGLIPALRSGEIEGSEDWAIALMQPGANPFGELAAALVGAIGPKRASLQEQLEEERGSPIAAAVRTLPVGGRLVLVIDQFEDLFATEDDGSRQRFLGELVSAVGAPGSRAQAVICLRADFYDRPLMYPGFARAFVPGVVNVLPMTPTEIGEAVVEPAKRAGVDVEPALLAEMTADTLHQPGALPLLQYALTELFEHRAGGRLALDGYHELGGIRSALSRRAEEVFGHLDSEARGVAVQLFLRLVRIRDRGKPIRARVAIADVMALDLDPVSVSNVLEAFGRSRLLSFDRDATNGNATVQAAHDALLTEWERLAVWIEDHRRDLQRHEALASSAQSWEAARRDPDFLLTGSRLTDYEVWSRSSDIPLTANERAFLDAGLDRRRRQEAEEAERLHLQRRLERRARSRLGALIAALTILAAGTTYGILAWPGSSRKPISGCYLAVGSPQGVLDRAYNQAMYEGLTRSAADLGTTSQARVPTTQADYEHDLQTYITHRCSLIVTPGFPLVSVADRARANPGQDFLVPDVKIPSLPNLMSVYFQVDQAAFLAGYLAAGMTRTGTVATFGGIPNYTVVPYMNGFAAGILDYSRENGASVRLLGWDPIKQNGAFISRDTTDFQAFTNEAKAKRIVTGFISRGADIIFPVAGEAGFGAGTAARRAGDVLLVGWDFDQFFTAPQFADLFLTSVVKRYDVAVEDVMKLVVDGKFHGGTFAGSLANGSVGLAPFHDLGPRVPQALQAKLDQLKAGIVDGSISVDPRDYL